MSTTYYDVLPSNVIRTADLTTGPDDPMHHHLRGVKWSGEMPIPAIGERVHIAINGLGTGTVLGYFVEPAPENGWLGVKVQLDKRPAWHVKQNPPDRTWALVFGAELRVPKVEIAEAKP